MTQGSVLRPVLKLSALFAIGSFLNLVPFVVDRRFVGQVGTDALAALGIANAALMVLVTFALGMALGTLSGVARRVGAGDMQTAARVVVQGLYVGAAFGALLLVAAFFVPSPVLALMGADPGVAEPAAYLGGYAVGSLALVALFASGLSLSRRWLGDLRLERVASVASLVVGVWWLATS